MANFKFSRAARIPSRKDFRAIFNHKLFFKNDLMKLYIAPNNLERARFAVSISSKIAPAATRNRLKRLAREAFRLSRPELFPGLDYLIIYSPALSKRAISDIRKITLDEVRQGLIALAAKAASRYENRRNK